MNFEMPFPLYDNDQAVGDCGQTCADPTPYLHRISLGDNQHVATEIDYALEGNVTIFRDVPVVQRLTSAGIYNGSEGTFEMSGVAILTTKFDNNNELKVNSRQLINRFVEFGLSGTYIFEAEEADLDSFVSAGPVQSGLGLDLGVDAQGQIYSFHSDFYPAGITPSVLKVGNIDDYSINFSDRGHTGLFVNRGKVEIDAFSRIIVDGDFVNEAGATLKGGRVTGSEETIGRLFSVDDGSLALPPDPSKGMYINNGATVKPGNSVGTLYLNAHSVFQSGFLEIEADNFAANIDNPGWDTLRVRSLTFPDESTMEVQLVSLDPTLGTPGLAADSTPTSPTHCQLFSQTRASRTSTKQR